MANAVAIDVTEAPVQREVVEDGVTFIVEDRPSGSYLLGRKGEKLSGIGVLVPAEIGPDIEFSIEEIDDLEVEPDTVEEQVVPDSGAIAMYSGVVPSEFSIDEISSLELEEDADLAVEGAAEEVEVALEDVSDPFDLEETPGLLAGSTEGEIKQGPVYGGLREILGRAGSGTIPGVGVADVIPGVDVALAVDDIIELQSRERAGLDISSTEKAALYASVPLSILGLGAATKPAYRSKMWDEIADKFAYFSPLGKLPLKDEYLKKRYRALGKVAEIDDIARGVNAIFSGADEPTKTAAYKYLTTKNADISMVPDEAIRGKVAAIKNQIDEVGKELVRRGLLSQAAYEAHRGEYLPRVYLRHILNEPTIAGGSKSKLGEQGYLKRRKDIDENIRRLILGEITDPGFLSAKGLAEPLRDMAVYDFLEEISQNTDWVFPNATTLWQGKKVTPQWLKAEAEMMRRQAEHYDEVTGNTARQLARQMDKTADNILEVIGKAPEDFRNIPDTPKYGALRGLPVRKEIYNDIVGSVQFVSPDAGFAQRLLGHGGIATKLTQLWKLSKVAMNPPTQARNFVSNGVLLHLSGVPFHRVPDRVMQAIKEIATNGKHYRVAKKHGVTATTFSANELYRIRKDIVKLEEKGLSPWAKLRNIGTSIVNAAGDAYQWSESVMKTAKIIDEMAKGATEADAVLEAQKWLFDYSLVSESVGYLRNAPMGIPFVTFYSKAFPRMLEAAIKRPQSFLPYYALPLAIEAYIAQEYDVKHKDIQTLKKALPHWMREKNSVYLLPYKDENGRWQAFDVGYMLPWGAYVDAATAGGRGDVSDMLSALGVGGAPITSITTAITTNVDPFTDREVVNPSDPPAEQLASIVSYAWRQAAPTWLTDIGAVKKIYDAWNKTLNYYGEPSPDMLAAWARIIGANIYPVDPETTRAKNLRRYKRELSDIKRRRTQVGRDRRLSEEDRNNKTEALEKMHSRKQLEFKEYMRESKVPVELR